MKMRFKRFLSGFMAVATLASVIVQPVTVSASELEPETTSFETMVKQHSFKHIEVDVDTVDAFQGSQKDIILYSTVRSSGNKYGIGFLKSEARINVAFSRARCLLIIVGDMKFLDNYKIRGNKFPEIIKYITESEGCRIIEK